MAHTTNYCKCCNIQTRKRRYKVVSHVPPADVISVSVVYHVFDSSLPQDRVVDAHTQLNDAFNCSNTTEQAKIPKNTSYPWKPVVGQANIQFVIHSVNRYDDTTHINDENGHILDQYISTVPPTDKMLNVYIGPTRSNLLGEAFFESNTCFVYSATVGGYKHPGELPHYDTGKTLVHEVGHCLGLLHTFNIGASCNDPPVFADVPKQILPNFDTRLFFDDATGEWSCSHDNRYLDRLENQNRSCLDGTVVNEMGVNYMDYGHDMISIMFTKSQTAAMRAFIQETHILDYEVNPDQITEPLIEDHPDQPSNCINRIVTFIHDCEAQYTGTMVALTLAILVFVIWLCINRKSLFF